MGIVLYPQYKDFPVAFLFGFILQEGDEGQNEVRLQEKSPS